MFGSRKLREFLSGGLYFVCKVIGGIIFLRVKGKVMSAGLEDTLMFEEIHTIESRRRSCSRKHSKP